MELHPLEGAAYQCGMHPWLCVACRCLASQSSWAMVSQVSAASVQSIQCSVHRRLHLVLALGADAVLLLFLAMCTVATAVCLAYAETSPVLTIRHKGSRRNVRGTIGEPYQQPCRCRSHQNVVHMARCRLQLLS